MATLNDFLFPVEKVNFSERFGLPANSDYSHAIIGTIDGKERVLNVCSNRYELVPNSDVFSMIEDKLKEAGVNYKSSYHMRENNAQFYAKYVIDSVKGKDVSVDLNGGKGNSDRVFPIISVDHSYNGLTKYCITFGYYRLICSNGLTIPVEGKEKDNLSITGRHTIKVRESIEMLEEKINHFITVNDLLTQRFKTLIERPIKNWVDRLESVLDAQKISTTGNQLEMIQETIKKESKQVGTKINDWLIYNGINSHIFKGVNSKGEKSKAAPEKKREKDENVLLYMLENA